MYTNTSMTLYSKEYDSNTRLDKWIRRVIDKVFWEDSKKANINKSGMSTADSVTVFVPLSSLGDISFKTGDCIVKGVVEDEVTKITDITKKYTHAHIVTTVDIKDFGSKNMQHVQIGGA